MKYVALLALQKVARSHPYLVSLHEDVILDCVDDPDISIRSRALDLFVDMVNVDNLTSIVGRLLAQLRQCSSSASNVDSPYHELPGSQGVTPAADFDDEEAEQTIRSREKKSDLPPSLPDDYRINVIRRILEMSSRNTYADIGDFDWYIDVLVELIGHVPADSNYEIATDIGDELRNVAVRVKSSRSEVVIAIESLLSIERRTQMLPSPGSLKALEPIIWVVGEYSCHLSNPVSLLNSIIHPSTLHVNDRTLGMCVQAVVKVFTFVAGDRQRSWTAERRSEILLLLQRMINFLEPLTSHPNLEVQERSVEYLELARLAIEACISHETSSEYGAYTDPPLLLTEAMPNLFAGLELRPVALDAQKRVPLPVGLDFNVPLDDNLQSLLHAADLDLIPDAEDGFDQFYKKRPPMQSVQPAAARLDQHEPAPSYQQSAADYLDPDLVAKRRAERHERHRDDPFYIPSEDTTSSNVLRTNNGDDLDLESIPIMELDLDGTDLIQPSPRRKMPSKSKARRQIEILDDDSIGSDFAVEVKNANTSLSKAKKSLLQVDSSGLTSLSLDGHSHRSRLEVEQLEAEEAEMAAAMKQVEKLRLEMQRNSEAIEIKTGPTDGVVVKRKKKKTAAAEETSVAGDEVVPKSAEKKNKKKKEKKKIDAVTAGADELDSAGPTAVQSVEDTSVRKKKVKRRQVTFDGDANT